MGQPLLPEHFFAQEGSLREEIKLQLEMLPTPFWGVAALEWDALQLRAGRLCLSSLTLRLPTGEVIDVPGERRAAAAYAGRGGAAAGQRAPLRVSSCRCWRTAAGACRCTCTGAATTASARSTATART